MLKFFAHAHTLLGNHIAVAAQPQQPGVSSEIKYQRDLTEEELSIIEILGLERVGIPSVKRILSIFPNKIYHSDLLYRVASNARKKHGVDECTAITTLMHLGQERI